MFGRGSVTCTPRTTSNPLPNVRSTCSRRYPRHLGKPAIWFHPWCRASFRPTAANSVERDSANACTPSETLIADLGFYVRDRFKFYALHLLALLSSLGDVKSSHFRTSIMIGILSELEVHLRACTLKPSLCSLLVASPTLPSLAEGIRKSPAISPSDPSDNTKNFLKKTLPLSTSGSNVQDLLCGMFLPSSCPPLRSRTVRQRQRTSRPTSWTCPSQA